MIKHEGREKVVRGMSEYSHKVVRGISEYSHKRKKDWRISFL
jgi:hypothetical protein